MFSTEHFEKVRAPTNSPEPNYEFDKLQPGPQTVNSFCVVMVYSRAKPQTPIRLLMRRPLGDLAKITR